MVYFRKSVTRSNKCSRRYHRLKGAVTPAAALILLLIFSMLTGLIEAARIQTAVTETEINAFAAQRSVAGYYHNQLWEDYDILAIDMSKDRDELMRSYMVSAAESAGNIYSADYESVELLPYYLTENGGDELVRQATSCMKYRIPADMINNLKGGDLQEDADKKQVENENLEARDEIVLDEEDYEEPDENTEDPREATADLASEDGFADYVTGDMDVSAREGVKQVPVHGTLPPLSVTDHILYNEYILSHFQTATAPEAGDRAMHYEVEYILYGSTNDEANLRAAIRRIRAIRLAMNTAYIMKHGTYEHAAFLAALVLSGWTLSPATVKATKYALIAAWAYAESALDIKALLKGKKVPLMKDASSWQLTYANIASFRFMKEKDNGKGLTYEDYLRSFLSLQKNAEKTDRVFDLIGSNLERKGKNGYLAEMAYGFDTSVRYNIDRRLFHSLWIPEELYRREFIAGYAYK
ncbi:MAG: DUF5702 domain-containing protein [Eubacteriales bacterium]|nr:DUF5702 domain-containing protein [Eubacteriales bacterium]